MRDFTVSPARQLSVIFKLCENLLQNVKKLVQHVNHIKPPLCKGGHAVGMTEGLFK